MISFDFEYYRPDTINEAVGIFQYLKSHGRNAIYYSGGTEIIGMARENKIYFDAAVDIKAIPECNVLETRGGELVIGSAVTLTRICEESPFPLLAEASSAAADHTSRDRITIGGNICGKIPYREAMLPFMICGSTITIAGCRGIRTVSLKEAFDRNLHLNDGEFLVQVHTATGNFDLPYEFVKRINIGQVGYPLVSAAVIQKGNSIGAAFSGVCGFPFRSPAIEDDLNEESTPLEQRINNAISHLPGPVLSDLQGSREYREFILRNILHDTLVKFGGAV